MSAAWQHEAACRDEDPSLFFDFRKAAQEQAKAICARCPVTQHCDQAAEGVTAGFWAGKDRRTDRYGESMTAPFLEEHGTDAAYERHRDRDEEPCARCRHAHACARQFRKTGAVW